MMKKIHAYKWKAMSFDWQRIMNRKYFCIPKDYS